MTFLWQLKISFLNNELIRVRQQSQQLALVNLAQTVRKIKIANSLETLSPRGSSTFTQRGKKKGLTAFNPTLAQPFFYFGTLQNEIVNETASKSNTIKDPQNEYFILLSTISFVRQFTLQLKLIVGSFLLMDQFYESAEFDQGSL